MKDSFHTRPFTSWGRISRVCQRVAHPRFRDELPALLAEAGGESVLAVGLLRSYGDTVLNSGGRLLDMTGLDRVISFDAQNGRLCAEAGLSLDAALTLIVPHGWYFATTPGTRFVTLAGAVANDVHGKNHHAVGTFGCAVRRLGLLRSDGTHHVLDRETGGDLFRATIGGLGLTGVITWLEVELTRIVSSRLEVERIAFQNLAQFFALAKASAESHEHTVAWIDCANAGAGFGRGIFQRANWASDGVLAVHPRNFSAVMPVEAPSGMLNKTSVRAFNTLYWRVQRSGPARRLQPYERFFYPLDAIGSWNRLYGHRGFYQYQCVVPIETAEPAMSELLRQIARAGAASFLAVLKTFGPRQSPGLLSFPREGATLALDVPNCGGRTLDLLSRLDRVVAEAGGRLYPAKDGRMPATLFRSGYAQAIAAFGSQIDPACSSEFWRRVSA